MFIFIAIGMLILIYIYPALRIMPLLGLPAPWYVVVWGLIIAIMLLMPLAMTLLFRGYESNGTDRLMLFSYTFLGFFALLFAMVFMRDSLWVALTAVKAVAVFGRSLLSDISIADTFDPSRREFIIKMMNITILGATGIATGIGLRNAVRKPTVLEVDIPIANLHDDLVGFRIVQISDLHVGPTIKGDFVRKVVDQVNALKPDMIAFTGDLGDGQVSYLRDDVAPLAELSAPYGTFFCTGNHEYYRDLDGWMDEVERLGMTNLLNEHRVIEHGRGRIIVAGVTDISARQMRPEHASDPDAAMSGAPEADVRLLLAHQPTSIFAATHLNFQLLLSGHTHGGQTFPWNLAAKIALPFVGGLYNHEGTWIYVNRGTGYWGPPSRVGVPSEITVVRLVRG